MSLLRDDSFNTRVRDCFTGFCCKDGSTPFVCWDGFKEEVKAVAIECASVRAFHEKAEHRELLHSLHELHALECDTPGSFLDEINIVKAQLQSHDNRRYGGAVVRARSGAFPGC